MSEVQVAERSAEATSTPIDAYLERVRNKLTSRFDAESVSLVLQEIQTHLTESAAEIEASGKARAEAERIAVSRFGAPERNAYFVLLASSLGHGDRLWGRIGFAIAIVTALGLTVFGLAAPGGYVAPATAVGTLFAVLLLVYGLACARAKAFCLTGKTIGTVAGIVAFAAVLDPDVSDLSVAASADGRLALGASRSLGDRVSWQTESGSTLALEFVEPVRGAQGMRLAGLGPDTADGQIVGLEVLGSGGVRNRTTGQDATSPLGAFGVCRMGGPSWLLDFHGWVPDSARLGIVWLLFVLLTNGAVWWISSLQRLQENGVLTVQ